MAINFVSVAADNFTRVAAEFADHLDPNRIVLSFGHTNIHIDLDLARRLSARLDRAIVAAELANETEPAKTVTPVPACPPDCDVHQDHEAPRPMPVVNHDPAGGSRYAFEVVDDEPAISAEVSEA